MSLFAAKRLLLLLAVSLATACSHSPPADVEESVVSAKHHGSNEESAIAVPAERTHLGTATKHVVEKGDTLFSIAFRYGIDFRVLAAVNGIRDPYTIYPGQQLVIKAGGMPVTPKPKPGQKAPAGTVVAATIRGEPGTVDAKTVDVKTPDKPVVAASAAATNVNIAPAKSTVAVPTRFVGGGSWQWPVRGKLLGGFNADAVGPKGIAVAGNAGDPVRAARDGRVVYTGDNLVGYGQLIILKHNDEYLSAYAHNRKVLVKEGDSVKAGDVIAEMGSTGADRTKLHFEVRRNGDPIDPLSVLPVL